MLSALTNFFLAGPDRLQRINERTLLVFIFMTLFSLSGGQIVLGFGILILIWQAVLEQKAAAKTAGNPFGAQLKSTLWRYVKQPVIYIYLCYVAASFISVVAAPKYGSHFWTLKEAGLFVIFIWVVFIIRDREYLIKLLRRYNVIIILFMVIGLTQIYGGIHYGKTMTSWLGFFGRYVSETYRCVLSPEVFICPVWEDTFYNYIYKYIAPVHRTGGNMYHVSGFLGHHLTYAGYLLLPITLFAGLFLWQKPSQKARNFLAGRLNVWLVLLAGVLLLTNLYFTQARSAYIGAFAGLMFLAVRERMRYAALMLVAAVAIVIVTKYTSTELFNRVVNRSFSMRSNTERILMWNTAFKYFAKNPVTGVGPANYIRYYKREWKKLDKIRKKTGDKDILLTKHKFRHPHNEYMNQAIMGGVLRLLAYLAVVGLPFYIFFKRQKIIKESDSYALIVGLVAYFVAFAFASLFQSYFNDDKVQMIFWFGYALFFVALPKETGVPETGVTDTQT